MLNILFNRKRKGASAIELIVLTRKSNRNEVIQNGLSNPATINAWLQQISAMRIKGEKYSSDEESIKALGKIANMFYEFSKDFADELEPAQFTQLAALKIKMQQVILQATTTIEHPNSYRKIGKTIKVVPNPVARIDEAHNLIIQSLKEATQQTKEKIEDIIIKSSPEQKSADQPHP
jgi:DNA-directed RNA polymerase subunit L